jgi:hypothetical protein
MTAMTISVLGVFPKSMTMYSDINFNDLNENSEWTDYVAYFFGAGYGEFTDTLAILGISVSVMVIVSIIALIQGNVTPLMIGIFGVMAIHMLGTSKEFFSTMFAKGGIAVVYLGICIFISIGALILFTIIEAPMGGDSG